jgi:hypothetical protein
VIDLRERTQKLRLYCRTSTVTLLSLHSVVAHTELDTDEFNAVPNAASFRLSLLLL